jgi:Skp family chaperone for outer membrane proteins
MKRLSIIAASILACSTIFAGSQFKSMGGSDEGTSSTQLGTVNLTKILTTPVFSDKQKAISEKYKAQSEELQQTAQTLKKEMDELEANRKTWDAEKVKKVTEDLDKRKMAFANQNAQLSQQQINEFQELSNQFINAVKAATAKVAEEKKLSIVISESDATTLYASKSLDITQSVIEKAKF